MGFLLAEIKIQYILSDYILNFWDNYVFNKYLVISTILTSFSDISVHQQDYVEGEGEEFDVIPNVKPSGVDWKAFPAAAYPWLKKDGAKTKTVPGNGNRRLLEKFGEEEIRVLQLSN